METTMTPRQTLDSNANGFVFCDRGNGCAFGEHGQFIAFDDDNLEAYGDIVMHKLAAPFESDDGVTVEFASDWIVGENGYEYRICS